MLLKMRIKILIWKNNDEKLFDDDDDVDSNVFVLTDMHGIPSGKRNVIHCKDICDSM